jgi:hypothetical protein
MKKLLTSFIFLLICTLGYSQETNKELLLKAETELSSAIAKEEYKKAAALKKEIEIRKQIEEAVANGDFELAGILQDEVKNLASGENEEEIKDVQKKNEEIGYNKIAPPPAGMAIIEIIRPITHDWHFHQPIFCDWELVGYVKGVSHFRLELSPGEHLIRAPAEKDHFVKINVVEGQTYFIYHDFKAAKWKSPECDLSPIRPTDTDRISRGLSVIDKYLSKVLDDESHKIIENYMKKNKIDIEKTKEKYNDQLKDNPKWTKSVSTEQYIPIKYL